MDLTINSNTEGAFRRAKTLLRKENALTDQECDELNELLKAVNGNQFMALTQDPKHARALREFDRHSWRRARPIIIAMIVLGILSALMSIYLSFYS